MTAVAAQVQWYKTKVYFGSTLGYIPCLPGVTLSVAENYAVPPIIGNFWQYSFGQGFINPSLDVSLVLRDVAGEVMSQPFWDAFHARSNDFSHDTANIGSITVLPANGDGFTMQNCKCDSYSLSCSKGGEISMNCHFVGSHVVPATTAPTFAGWSNANILRFKNLVFASPLDAQVFEVGVSYSNNCSPNMALDGSEFPADQNAGMQTASMNITTQISTVNRPDNGTFPVPVTLTPIQFQIVGSLKTATFVAPNPVNNSKRMRQISAGRVMQPSNYLLLGGDGIASAPLQVTVA